MFLVALLPGGKEADHDLNLLLEPLIQELEQLWAGVRFRTAMQPSGCVIRAALLLVSCDLPATRKLSGFKTYNYCCNRCTKKFEMYDSGEETKDGRPKLAVNCSGSETCAHRSDAHVRSLMDEYRQCRSGNSQEDFVTRNDVRYSILCRLVYFDLVHMVRTKAPVTFSKISCRVL
jgi:hypothetical protein